MPYTTIRNLQNSKTVIIVCQEQKTESLINPKL
jgi:hypothetical protein